jgi:oligopeptidase B
MTNSFSQFKNAKFPVAEKKEHWRTLHGDRVNDNYYWMYDYFGKGADSTKVVEYLTAENKYVEAVMSDTKNFQADLYTEMKARIKEKDESVPVFKNGYYYYSRTETGKQYYKYCRKKGNLNAKEEILLDIDKLAEGNAYYAASGFAISEDNKLLAFGVDKISRRQYTIYVKNLQTGEMLTDAVTNTEGDPCWANDNKTFFYTSKNPVTLLSEKIQRHTLGTDAADDAIVYAETDKSNYIGVDKSKNSKYIFIVSQATMSSEYRMINADKPNDAFKVFQPRMKDVLYNVITLDNKFLIRTNKDGAKNFKSG